VTTPVRVTLEAPLILTPYLALLVKLPQVSVTLPIVVMLTPSPELVLASDLTLARLTLPWLLMTRPVPLLYRKLLIPVSDTAALPRELSSVRPVPELLLAVMLLRVMAPLDRTDKPLTLLLENVFVPVMLTAMGLPAAELSTCTPMAELPIAVRLFRVMAPRELIYNPTWALELNVFVPVNCTPWPAVELVKYAPCLELLVAVTLLRVMAPRVLITKPRSWFP